MATQTPLLEDGLMQAHQAHRRQSTTSLELGGALPDPPRMRWVMAALFASVSCTNGLLYMVPSAITTSLVNYYGVSDFLVNTTALIIYILYVPLAFPALGMAKRFGVRGCVLIAAATDMLGSILRVFAWSPSSGSFLWMLIGTIWIAVSVPFFFSLPARVSAIWFPPQERALATSVCVMANQAGIALGFVIGPVAIGNGDHIATRLHWLHLGLAVVCTLVTVAVALWFKETPPHTHGYENRSFTVMKQNRVCLDVFALVRQPAAWFLSCTYCSAACVWWASGILLNQLMNQVGFGDFSVLLSGTLLQAFAVPSMWLAGVVADRTQRFPTIIATCLLCGTALLGFMAWYLNSTTSPQLWVIVLTLSLFGATYAGAQGVLFEFTAKVTFPVLEHVSSTLNACVAMGIGVSVPIVADALDKQPNGLVWNFVMLAGVAAVGLVVFVIGLPWCVPKRSVLLKA